MSPETSSYLDVVERHSGRKIMMREEIGFLYEHSRSSSLRMAFNDLLFYSKFITHGLQVLKRSGSDSTDTVKLSNEIQTSFEKVTTLLRTIIKETPEQPKQAFVARYLSVSHESLQQLTALLSELTLVKNYSLDSQS